MTKFWFRVDLKRQLDQKLAMEPNDAFFASLLGGGGGGAPGPLFLPRQQRHQNSMPHIITSQVRSLHAPFNAFA